MRYRVYRQRRRIPPFHAQTVTIGITATAEAPTSAAALDAGDPLALYGPYTRMTLAAYRRYSSLIDQGVGIPSKYGAQRAEPSANVTELWAYVRVEHDRTEYIDSRNRYRKYASLVVQIYGPKEKGTKSILQAADAVVDAFRDVTDVWNVYRTPTMDQVGAFSAAQRGGWWRVDVRCPFYSDDSVRSVTRATGSPAASLEEIHKIIRSKVINEIGTPYGVTVLTDNSPSQGVSTQTQWVSLSIRTATSLRRHAGPAGNYIVPGVAFAQVFTPIPKGEKEGLILVDRIAERFRSVGDSGVTFLTPSLVSVGRQGAWWQDNVQLPWEAEEAM